MTTRAARFSIAFAVLFLVWLTVPAEAMDPTGKYANSPQSAWFSRQFNSEHGFCCTMADAHLYNGAYDLEADVSVTIPLPDGSNLSVKREKLLPLNPNDPNPPGKAVWWCTPTPASGTYCFAL